MTGHFFEANRKALMSHDPYAKNHLKNHLEDLLENHRRRGTVRGLVTYEHFQATQKFKDGDIWVIPARVNLPQSFP